MGSVISTAAEGLGSFVGNAVSAPFRALFGSCDVCSGTWDLPCFIENLCISSLAKLGLVCIIAYCMLFVVYLLCKLGIVQCVAKNAFKAVWKPCSACCRALGAAYCLLWHKVRHTERVYRGRRGQRERDVEMGEPSSTSRYDTGSSFSSISLDYGDGDRRRGVVAVGDTSSRGKSSAAAAAVREGRKDRVRQSLRLKRVVSFKVEHAARVSQESGRRHRHLAEPRRTEVSSLSSMRVHGSPARDRSQVHRRPHIKVEPRHSERSNHH